MSPELGYLLTRTQYLLNLSSFGEKKLSDEVRHALTCIEFLLQQITEEKA